MKKILMKMDKGIVLGAMVAILLIGNFLWIVSEMNYIPFTRTFFLDYNSFYNKNDKWLFPEELPLSVHDVKYYYYTGHCDKKSGVTFVVEDVKEYQEMKEFFSSKFSESKVSLSKVENIQFLSDQSLTSDFIDEEEIEFVNKLIMNGEGDYNIWEYMDSKVDGDGIDYIDGVICNDITHEIILFTCKDVHN